MRGGVAKQSFAPTHCQAALGETHSQAALGMLRQGFGGAWGRRGLNAEVEFGDDGDYACGQGDEAAEN